MREITTFEKKKLNKAFEKDAKRRVNYSLILQGFVVPNRIAMTFIKHTISLIRAR